MFSFESLDRLENVYHLLVSATLADTPPDLLAILALRQRFAVEFKTLLLTLGDDLNAPAHGTLHDELQDRLGTLRIRLMSYTLDWQPRQIEDDRKGYRQAAQDTADLVRQFIAETRDELEQAARSRPAATEDRATG